jgi:hypothetical protein
MQQGYTSSLYPADWWPGFSVKKPGYLDPLFLQDYSYAGYHNGEKPLPRQQSAITRVSAATDGSQDASAAVQAAIDGVLAQGGGVVFLPAGVYRLDKPLRILGSNLVLRGAGSGLTKLWFKDGGGISENNKSNVLVGSSQAVSEKADSRWKLTAAAGIFDQHVDVADTAGLAVGDSISIAWNITAEFKAEHNATNYWNFASLGSRKTFFRRTITALERNRVHFNVPLRYAINLRDNPVVLKASNYAQENGLEGFSLTNAVGVDKAWSTFGGSTAIMMRDCKNCWINDVKSYAQGASAYQIRSHGITVATSFQVTVDNAHLQKAEHLGGGGNGYLFHVTRSNEVLIKDSSAQFGRHNFTINWDFGSSGNVFLRVKSGNGRVCSALSNQKANSCSLGPTDFHHALAIANLYDGAQIDDALDVGNRRDDSSGAGPTGTLNTFWNIRGIGVVNAYNLGLGYVIGTASTITLNTRLDHSGSRQKYLALGTAPEDYSEWVGQNNRLFPVSLYEDQLARRLRKP